VRKLSSTRLFPIDPCNLKHIELLDEFEKENNYGTPIGKFKNKQESSNDIYMELVLEEKSKVQDICHIEGYKDVKSCTISFLPKKKKKRKIVSMATDYALSTLGMESVFLKINPEDTNLLEYMNTNEFECLGDEKGSIIYLKEKQY